MTLSADTQQLLEQVEEATRRPVHLQPNPALPSLATARVARGDAPAHVVSFRPDAPGADYALASQLATVLRIFQVPPEQRYDLVTSEAGRESVRRSLSGPGGTLTPHKLPEAVIEQATDQIFNGLMTQLRSLPVEMRVAAWLRDARPGLRGEQERYFGSEMANAAQSLAPQVRAMTPPTVFSANAALNPEGTQVVGTPAFAEAVGSYFAGQFAPLGGDVTVAVTDEEIAVLWVPDGASLSPIDHAVSLLRGGRRAEGVSLLRLLLSARPDDAMALYNLGVAESDLGDLDAAIGHLTRAAQLDPTDEYALVGLGVAQQRAGDSDAAVRSLERAVAVAPYSVDARRNLGAVLGSRGRSEEAIEQFRRCVALTPDDQRSVYGLAHSLEQGGDEEQITEADGLYRRAVALDPHSEIAELARRALSDLAERTFHAGTGSPIRMGAAMYCLDALKTFAPMDETQVKTISFEVGMLGARGLDVNDPAPRYTLRSLPGTFSGLHLMCLMYVGFQRIAPGQDIGFDLAAEYAMAQQMFSEGQRS